MPRAVCTTHTGDILVNLKDDGDFFKLIPSSRRLIQRMTVTGKVLQTYEFQEDGKTRLFTAPGKTTENKNSDICALNILSENNGEVIVLREDGKVRFVYRGRDDPSKFYPTGVACDSSGTIIVTERTNASLHLLNPSGEFLGYLLSGMASKPTTIAVCQKKLWIGFRDGLVKVYKYTE